MGVRLRVLVSAARKFGIAIEEPKSGSHWKATKGQELYPIPAHNGLKSEIDDVYVRGLCRAFGIDVAELKELF